MAESVEYQISDPDSKPSLIQRNVQAVSFTYSIARITARFATVNINVGSYWNNCMHPLHGALNMHAYRTVTGLQEHTSLLC